MGVIKYIADKLYSNDKEVALVEDAFPLNHLGLAKAWVKFEPDTSIIANSIGVISVTSRGRGKWQVNFLPGIMNTPHYIMAGVTNASAIVNASGTYASTKDTAELDIRSITDGAYTNPSSVRLVFFGGQ